MNKRILQNEELDHIGRKLLDAASVKNEEIEQIVGSSMLFDAVKARIETERRKQNSKNVSGGWAHFHIWNWQSASAMALLLFTVGVISLIIFSKFTPQQQTEQAAAPEIKSKIAQIEVPITTQIPVDSLAIAKTKNPVVESPKIAKQVFINKILKPRKSNVQTPTRQRRFQPNQNESAGEFYALAFAENPGENGEELQIVRAELSRSSLFALGVNLPIEN
ncbi:MAG TPA: hypothetical protein VNI60_05365, partial [Pyrinomonadaceae bacterium]|nr:hypothetical protein [Pyrinomonadaceae bacterium]